MEPKNENTANDLDNHLIISAEMDPDHAEKPIDEEVTRVIIQRMIPEIPMKIWS